MKLIAYWTSVALTAIFALLSAALFLLLFQGVTLQVVMAAMFSGTLAAASGAVAVCTWQSPYELNQERHRRAFERLKKSGPPTPHGRH